MASFQVLFFLSLLFMGFEFITGFSIWLLPICLLLGVAYSYLLYPSFRFHKPFKGLAKFALRFLLVSMLSFFLLSPVLRYLETEYEKPVVIMVLDESNSMVNAKDSSEIKDKLMPVWSNAKSIVGDELEVDYLSVAGKAEPGFKGTFEGKKTDLTAALKSINNLYRGKNVAGIVFCSDGIYNRGGNPLFQKLKIDAPLFTIGVGDTTERKDIALKNVMAASVVFLNNEFQVLAEGVATGFKGKSATLNILENGKILASAPLQFTSEKDFFSKTFIIQADKPGAKHLTFSVSTLPGETILQNNKRDVIVDVTDGRQKIVIIYNSPHPDIAALRSGIEENKNYEVLASHWADVSEDMVKQMSLAVLVQLPVVSNLGSGLINKLKNGNVPMLIVSGSGSFIDGYGLFPGNPSIAGHNNRWSEVQATFNEAFQSFVMSEGLKNRIQSWPPLMAPYGQYRNTATADVLAWQRVGNVTSKNPLFCFYSTATGKIGWILGEGLWRWKLHDYRESNTHEYFNELCSKLVQYLTVKDDKKRFRAETARTIVEEDENLLFTAELYNKNMEPVNDREVKLKLTNSKNKDYTFTFSPSGKHYALNAGIFPADIYKWEARAKEENVEPVKGKLTISPLQAETAEVRADFSVLQALALQNNGNFYKAGQLNEVLKRIRNLPGSKPVSHTSPVIKDLINLKWIFFLLLALLTTEWFIRKWEGGY